MMSWWRHQMETFSALLAICAGNSPVPGEFPAHRPVTRSFGVFFDLRLNKRLSKQSWGWWFETLPRPLWRHNNGNFGFWIVTRKISIWRQGTCTLTQQCYICHFDNFQCSQWRQFRQNGIFVQMPCLFYNCSYMYIHLLGILSGADMPIYGVVERSFCQWTACGKIARGASVALIADYETRYAHMLLLLLGNPNVH